MLNMGTNWCIITPYGVNIYVIVSMFLMQLDFDDTYSILVYGAGALVALWLSSAVVGAIDSIPVVGLDFKVL